MKLMRPLPLLLLALLALLLVPATAGAQDMCWPTIPGADNVRGQVAVIRNAMLLGERHGLQQQTSTPPAPDGGLVFYVHVSDGGQTYAAVQPDGGAFDIADALGPLIPANARTRTIQRHLADDLDERGINCKNFGAKGDGTTDDTAALQACINAAGSAQGGKAILPAGTFKVVSIPITALNGVGVVIEGAGPINTKILYGGSGSPDGGELPIVNLENCWLCTLKDLGIYGNGTPGLVGVRLTENTNTKTVLDSHMNTLLNLELGGGSSNSLYNGIQILPAQGAGSVDDRLNDAHRIEHVDMANIQHTCIQIGGSQAKLIDIGSFNFINSGQYGITAGEPDGSSFGGSFRAHDGYIGQASKAAFAIGSPNDYAVIDSVNMEADGAMIWESNGSGAGEPVLVQGSRFSGDALRCYNITDAGVQWPTTDGSPWQCYGRLIETKGADSYTLIGNQFGDTGVAVIYPGASWEAWPTVFINQPAAAQYDGGKPFNITAIGNHFGFVNNDAETFLVHLTGTNTIQDNADRIYTRGVMENNYFGATGLENSGQGSNATAIGYLTTAQGISATPVRARNLRGQATVTGAATSGAWTFAAAEADASYFAQCSPSASTGTPAAGSNRTASLTKATGGVTVNVEAAPGVGNSVTFDCVLER